MVAPNRSPRATTIAALVLLLAVGAVFLVVGWSRISAPFGDSDEGINTAVWANNSRGLRELGIVDSRLGAKRLDGSVYATHPPLIVIQTATVESFFGEREWATRLPAWLGTLAAIALLYRLLRAAGREPLVASAAVVAAVACPMAFIYGPMLDTPVTSFPLGVLVVLLWFRQWQAAPGDHPVRPFLVGLAAAVAALSGWQATVLVGLCGLTLLARAARRRSGAVGDAVPYVVGGIVGLGLSLAWTRWAYGDFSVLTDKFAGRSGESGGVGLGDMVSFQVPWLFELLGLSIVGVGACVGALRDRTLRPLAAMALGSVLLYAVIFRQAATGHQYWNYWALLPAAVGFGYAFDGLTRAIGRQSRSALAPVAALAGVCVLLGAFNLVRSSKAERYIVDGQVVARELIASEARLAGAGRGADEVAYLGEEYRADAWVSYYARVDPTLIHDRAELDAFAARQPTKPVVVLGTCGEGAASYPLCRQLLDDAGISGPGIVRPAAELAGR